MKLLENNEWILKFCYWKKVKKKKYETGFCVMRKGRLRVERDGKIRIFGGKKMKIAKMSFFKRNIDWKFEFLPKFVIKQLKKDS